ncbi:hypothetical protein HPB47_018386, partial [Ixodes persulcatus]
MDIVRDARNSLDVARLRQAIGTCILKLEISYSDGRTYLLAPPQVSQLPVENRWDGPYRVLPPSLVSHVVSRDAETQGTAKNPLAAQATPQNAKQSTASLDRYGGPLERDVTSCGPGGADSSPHSAGSHQGFMVMVYGLNSEKINAEKLFSLLCLYGSFIRIKFVKNKMECPLAEERAVGHQSNVQFFDNKMQLGYSNQVFLNNVPLQLELRDGTPCFKDFMGNCINRFTNLEAVPKNHIQPPSRGLHFFNLL